MSNPIRYAQTEEVGKGAKRKVSFILFLGTETQYKNIDKRADKSASPIRATYNALDSIA